MLDVQAESEHEKSQQGLEDIEETYEYRCHLLPLCSWPAACHHLMNSLWKVDIQYQDDDLACCDQGASSKRVLRKRQSGQPK